MSPGRGPAKWGAGPTGRGPTLRQCMPAGGKSLWAEEALSKQRNAAWSPGDGGGEEGGGGAAVAARLPASPPASPGELPPTTPSQGCGGAGEEGGGCARRLFSTSLLQTRVGTESARSAAPCGCSARGSELNVRSVPVAGLGAEPAKVSESKQSARNLPRNWATGVPNGPWQPRPCAPSSLRGAGELELALVTPAASPIGHRFGPGCETEGTPEQWI